MKDVLLLLYAATAATMGEWVVRTAAFLGALSLIVAVISRVLKRSVHMGRDISQLVEFARTGDDRIERIEGEMSELRSALTRMADELARVPELAEAVLTLTGKVADEVQNAAAVHDQIITDSLARDEAIVSRLEALCEAGPLTPPHGTPALSSDPTKETK